MQSTTGEHERWGGSVSLLSIREYPRRSAVGWFCSARNNSLTANHRESPRITAQLHAWLALLERRDPKPARTDAFGQLGLRQAGGFPALAYECADNGGVEGIGHASVWLFVNLGSC